MSLIKRSCRIWFFCLLACVAATAFAFNYLDMPIAQIFSGNIAQAQTLSAGLSSFVVLSIEAATAMALIAVRMSGRPLSGFGKALLIACATSMCAYAVNDGILKVLLGIPNPGQALTKGISHSVHFLSGSKNSSFPSGHMILAGSFAGVFMTLYRSSIPPLSILLAIAAGALVIGDWHFVSDVIAGAFLGISAGVLAGSLWLSHSEG